MSLKFCVVIALALCLPALANAQCVCTITGKCECAKCECVPDSFDACLKVLASASVSKVQRTDGDYDAKAAWDAFVSVREQALAKGVALVISVGCDAPQGPWLSCRLEELNGSTEARIIAGNGNLAKGTVLAPQSDAFQVAAALAPAVQSYSVASGQTCGAGGCGQGSGGIIFGGSCAGGNCGFGGGMSFGSFMGGGCAGGRCK